VTHPYEVDRATPAGVLGVLGTLVWDRIWHPAGGPGPVEQWGGIAYSLSAAAASCPPGWRICPIIRIGADLEEPARSFLTSLPHLGPLSRLAIVSEPNNRVELRYLDSAERTERLSGGVGGWSRDELGRAVDGVDALYVNFISGYEMSLETAQSLRDLPVPTYADLHSLYLDDPGDRERRPRRLPDWERWLGAFDAVQLNLGELSLTGEPRADPLSLLPDLPGHGPALAVATLGGSGAAYARRADRGGALEWPRTRVIGRTGSLETGIVPSRGGPLSGDPTGCGDIWGAVLFTRLLAGDSFERAIDFAHAAAAARLREEQLGELWRPIAAAIQGQH
jgi:hypothetical protein